MSNFCGKCGHELVNGVCPICNPAAAQQNPNAWQNQNPVPNQNAAPNQYTAPNQYAAPNQNNWQNQNTWQGQNQAAQAPVANGLGSEIASDYGQLFSGGNVWKILPTIGFLIMAVLELIGMINPRTGDNYYSSAVVTLCFWFIAELMVACGLKNVWNERNALSAAECAGYGIYALTALFSLISLCSYYNPVGTPRYGSAAILILLFTEYRRQLKGTPRYNMSLAALLIMLLGQFLLMLPIANNWPEGICELFAYLTLSFNLAHNNNT